MSADGLMLVLVFVLCGAGALLGIIIPDRRNPVLLSWVGSLVSLLTLWVSGNVLRSGHIFQRELWTIRGLGPLMVSLDRLSAFFLCVAAVVVLASSIFSACYLKRANDSYLTINLVEVIRHELSRPIFRIQLGELTIRQRLFVRRYCSAFRSTKLRDI
jgi:formate hydrogenlyase subunit 3/multisubunit Na+/H+ antiporter MnhD subunit